MTTRKRRYAEAQNVMPEEPAVPARWEEPGKIESLPSQPQAAIEPYTLADALAQEQIAAAEAGAAVTPLAIGDAQAKAEADIIADQGMFHPGGHRHTRRGGQ